MSSWIDTILKSIGYARFNTSLPTVGGGSASELQCDTNGRLIVSVGAQTALASALTTWQKSPASGSVGLSKESFTLSTAKRVRRITVMSGYGTPRYFHLHDLLAHASIVSGTTIPIFPGIQIAAQGVQDLDFGEPGLLLTAGLSWCASSTFNVSTIDASALWGCYAEIVS